MDTIFSISKIIEEKKKNFIYNHSYFPNYINMDISIYRKLEKFLVEQDMTIQDFEQKIDLSIKISNDEQIALH